MFGPDQIPVSLISTSFCKRWNSVGKRRYALLSCLYGGSCFCVLYCKRAAVGLMVWRLLVAGGMLCKHCGFVVLCLELDQHKLGAYLKPKLPHILSCSHSIATIHTTVQCYENKQETVWGHQFEGRQHYVHNCYLNVFTYAFWWTVTWDLKMHCVNSDIISYEHVPLKWLV